MAGNLAVLKQASSYGDMMPGEWYIDLTDAEGRIGANKVAVRCPVCGVRTHLNEKHHIDEKGRVTASVLCPHATAEYRRNVEAAGAKGCTWHEYVTLENWTGEKI